MPVRSVDAVERALGARIRSARETRGWNQQRLGEALGITFQQIQKYESGKSRIAASRLASCARALEADPVWLLFGEGREATDLVPGAPAIKREQQDERHSLAIRCQKR